MHCVAPEPNVEIDQNQGGIVAPPHPNGDGQGNVHSDGESHTITWESTSDWAEYSAPHSHIQYRFKIHGSLKGPAKDAYKVWYQNRTALFTAVAYLRKFERVVENGEFSAEYELTWNDPTQNWEKPSQNGVSPRAFPVHSVVPGLECDPFDGSITAPNLENLDEGTGNTSSLRTEIAVSFSDPSPDSEGNPVPGKALVASGKFIFGTTFGGGQSTILESDERNLEVVFQSKLQ